MNRFMLALVVVLLSACGGGGGDFLATQPAVLTQPAQLCHDALVARGVASISMLGGAAVSIDADGRTVIFYNSMATTDPQYHIYGSCIIQDGAITRVGQ